MKKIRRLHQTIFFILVVTAFLPVTLSFAQSVSVEASVERNAIELGSATQFTITIYGSQGSNSAPDLPDIPGLKSQYLGPSTRVSIVNGQYSSSVAFIYNIFPLKTGQFQIPALSLTISGKDYKTQPIDIQVTDAGVAPKKDAQEQTTNLQDKIFLVMGTARKEFYLNEKIPLTIKLFVNGLSVKDIQYPQFNHADFVADDFQEPRQYQQVIGGISYNVVEFKIALYANKLGDLTLGPAKQACNILVKREGDRQRDSGDLESIFGEDFFQGFLGTYHSQTVTLESADLKIHVLALPEEGKPKEFAGAVGKFTFEATLSPAQVKVGDPLTLRMQLAGSGNLKAVSFPALPAQNDFKSYEPQIKDEAGKKTLEQVVIPTTDKVKEFPALTFSYFDPEQKNYMTLAQGPFPLSVLPLTKEEQLKVVGTPQPVSLSATPEVTGQDISYIKDRPGKLRNTGYRLYRQAWFLVIALLVITLWPAFYLNFRFSQRLKTDLKYARRFHAPRHAQQGLQQAKGFLDRREEKAFYDELFKTLQQYLGNKFHLSIGAVTLNSIENILAERGLDKQILDKIKTVFDECEMVRYASIQLEPGRMHESFRKAQEIIDFFERNA